MRAPQKKYYPAIATSNVEPTSYEYLYQNIIGYRKLKTSKIEIFAPKIKANPRIKQKPKLKKIREIMQVLYPSLLNEFNQLLIEAPKRWENE